MRGDPYLIRVYTQEVWERELLGKKVDLTIVLPNGEQYNLYDKCVFHTSGNRLAFEVLAKLSERLDGVKKVDALVTVVRQ